MAYRVCPGCGREYSRADWRKLELLGSAEDSNASWELRHCGSCGESIGLTINARTASHPIESLADRLRKRGHDPGRIDCRDCHSTLAWSTDGLNWHVTDHGSQACPG